MPKITERDRLADLEQRQRKIIQEIEETRKAVRGKYAAIVPELEVEAFTEREFRELISLAIKAGPAAALGALKARPHRPS